MGVFPHVDYALHLTRIECKKCEYAYNAIMQPDSQTQVFKFLVLTKTFMQRGAESMD